jgi:uncharacterized protein YciI
MRLVAIFEDNPAMVEVRQKFEPAHLSFLEKYR